jgi:hypothetical protein
MSNPYYPPFVDTAPEMDDALMPHQNGITPLKNAINQALQEQPLDPITEDSSQKEIRRNDIAMMNIGAMALHVSWGGVQTVADCHSLVDRITRFLKDRHAILNQTKEEQVEDEAISIGNI